MPKSFRLKVCLRGTCDAFPNRVIIRNIVSAIAIWRTVPVSPFAIYQQSSDVIEPDMNIITCFTCEEYIG